MDNSISVCIHDIETGRSVTPYIYYQYSDDNNVLIESNNSENDNKGINQHQKSQASINAKKYLLEIDLKDDGSIQVAPKVSNLKILDAISVSNNNNNSNNNEGLINSWCQTKPEVSSTLNDFNEGNVKLRQLLLENELCNFFQSDANKLLNSNNSNTDQSINSTIKSNKQEEQKQIPKQQGNNLKQRLNLDQPIPSVFIPDNNTKSVKIVPNSNSSSVCLSPPPTTNLEKQQQQQIFSSLSPVFNCSSPKISPYKFNSKQQQQGNLPYFYLNNGTFSPPNSFNSKFQNDSQQQQMNKSEISSEFISELDKLKQNMSQMLQSIEEDFSYYNENESTNNTEMVLQKRKSNAKQQLVFTHEFTAENNSVSR